MIKFETVGMIEVSKNNPIVVRADEDTPNYSFKEIDGITYFIHNVGTETMYPDAADIKKGEFLRCFVVEANKDQKFVIDESHINYGDSKTYDDITVGETYLTINDEGSLDIADSDPGEGIYFKVTDKTILTEKAVKARVVVA